jgi:hypothetical protein
MIVAAGVAPAVLRYLAVEAAVSSGELRAVPVAGKELSRSLRGVWIFRSWAALQESWCT